MDQTVGSADQDADDGGHGPEPLQQHPAFRGPIAPASDHPHSTNHFALLYRDRDTQFAAAIPFIREGLERNERCLYVADDNSREAVVEAMRARGIDVDSALESGALSIHTKSDTYLRTGEFDREAMLQFWEETLEAATGDEDYAGIRAAAEMTWALDESTSLDLLAEYEAMLNDIYQDEDYAVLCQYNRDRFPAETVRDVIRTHPYLIQDGRVSSNTFYTPPEDFFAPDASTDVDRMMQALHERDQARTELTEREEYFRQIFERSHDAILLFDPEADEILDANPAAAELLGYTRDELRSREPADLHPDLETFRRFADEQLEDGTGDTAELAWRTRRGESVPVEISMANIQRRGQPVVLAVVRDISERKEHERYQRRLYEIAADADKSFEEKLRGLFELGCARFDMELGGLARIDPDSDLFEVEVVSDDHKHLRPGAQIALSETYCRVLDSSGETVGVTNPVTDGLDEMRAYTEFGVKSYIGTRLSLEDGLDRTLFFVSSEPREQGFTEDERTFHHLLGQWIQSELEREHQTDQLTALNNLNKVVRDINHALARQSTRDEIERVVCERLADSDSYEFAWVGTVDEQTSQITPSTAVDAAGYLDDVTITADESQTGRGPGGAAIRTGEAQFVQNAGEQLEYEPWRERAEQHGVGAIASIPLAYEATTYGVLNVYTARENGFEGEEREVVKQLGEIVGLAIAAVEREQQLRHERERLEFINRLIRHNLLNSLNVVQARTKILDGHVDPAVDSHLETVHERTAEMIDLIETLRSLMRAIVEEDTEVTPLDVGAVLRDEVEQAREAFSDATFEVQTDLDALPRVMADDLLEEVFENLLMNAVQHNDKETPRVVIDADVDEESVTVAVADNGPGVPADIRDRIFEKGTKGFESPGTGFGLHLVREIVEMYDGEIAVEDNEPTGAVFSVTLPRSS